MMTLGSSKRGPWDNPSRWKKEDLVKDVKYYARSCGYDVEDQEVITQDGYKSISRIAKRNSTIGSTARRRA